MNRYVLLLLCSLVLCTASVGSTDGRRGWPFSSDEQWEGYRKWTPDRDRRWRGQPLPDRFTVDKPGKCEVICERVG
jgi:hypothetical protein